MAGVYQQLTEVTESTISMNWSSSDVIDFVWCSLDGGANWEPVGAANGKSGSFTMSSLTSGSTYSVTTRMRTKNIGTTHDTDALPVETYEYPHCTGTPDFTIGSMLSIGLYNPLKRNVIVELLGADGRVIRSDTTDKNVVSGYNSMAEQNLLYASIPSSASGIYRVRVIYGSEVATKTGGTYSINFEVCSPVIGDIDYLDTNGACTAITGDPQKIIRNHSTVTISADGIEGRYFADVVRCTVVVNAESYPMTLNAGEAIVQGVVIDSASDITGFITCTDSRGLSSTKDFNISMLDWVTPTAVIDLKRKDNFYSESHLTVRSAYSILDGQNTIAIRARYKKPSDGAYGAYITLTDGVTETLNLDSSSEYIVQVLLTDRLGSATYNLTLESGTPIIFFDKHKSSVGINCLPSGTRSFEVDGVNLGRSALTAYPTSNVTNLVADAFTIIRCTASNGAGGALSLSSGGIKIGAGVNKVMISGMVNFNNVTAAGIRYADIWKNSTASSANRVARAWYTLGAGTSATLTIASVIVNISENDILYICYQTPTTGGSIMASGDGIMRTALTVQTL